MGPLLQPPKDQTPVNTIDAPVTPPVYVPASLQYVPRIPPHGLNTPALPPDSQANPKPRPIPKPFGANRGRRHGSFQRTSFSPITPKAIKSKSINHTRPKQFVPGRASPGQPIPRKQRVPSTGKQRVSGWNRPFVDYSAMHVREQNQVYPERVAHTIVQPKPPPSYENISLEEETDYFIAWCEAGERRQQDPTQHTGPRLTERKLRVSSQPGPLNRCCSATFLQTKL